MNQLLEQIREAYVQKGYQPLAISALVGIPEAEVAALIKENGLEAARALFLAQNPNISARLASQIQLASILDRQQKGMEVSSAELAFLTKTQDLQRQEAEEDKDDFYRLSGEELDRKILGLWRKAYHKTKNTYAPRTKRRIGSQKARPDENKPEKDSSESKSDT